MPRPLRMLYIIGVPGAGKTTLVRRLVGQVPKVDKQVPYIYYAEYGPGVIQLGRDREKFGGTDALGMAAQKHVLAWLEEQKPHTVLAEGDRLANKKFFDAVKAMGYDLTVAYLEVSDELAERRRKKRNAAIGKAQNEQWLRTRKTKVANLVEEYITEPADEKWILPGDDTGIARVVLRRHPVIKIIRKCAS